MTEIAADAARRAQLPARLESLVAKLWPGARVGEPAPLMGGESGLTYRATLRGGPVPTVIVKVAVPGRDPVRNRDVLRQARILRLIAGTPRVRVPAVYGEDAGQPPEIPPLFVMADAPGEAFEPNIDKPGAAGLPEPATLADRARAAVAMLAAMHRDPGITSAVADQPVVGLADEVERWTRAFTKVPKDLGAGYEKCAEVLSAAIPEECAPCLVHGDYRLGNLVCAGSDVRAIIDWEIWTRSDPRIDLAWLMLTADGDLHPFARRRCPGMPGPAEVHAEYERVSGQAVDRIDWFVQLTLFKLAAMCGLILRTRRSLGQFDEWSSRATERVPRMLARVLELGPSH